MKPSGVNPSSTLMRESAWLVALATSRRGSRTKSGGRGLVNAQGSDDQNWIAYRKLGWLESRKSIDPLMVADELKESVGHLLSLLNNMDGISATDGPGPPFDTADVIKIVSLF